MLAPRAGPLLSLAAATAAAAIGFDRVFQDTGWVAPVFAAAAFALLVGVATVHWKPARALALSAAGLVVLASGATLGHTTFFGLPTAATLEGLWPTMADGIEQLGKAEAPAPTSAGLVFLSVAGVWTVSAAAVWLALRTSAPLAAIVPPLGLHMVLAILDPFGLDGPTTFAVVVAAVLYVSVHHTLSLPAEWLAAESGTRRLRARRAFSSGAVALMVGAAGLALGPSLPGARADALIDVGQPTGSGDGPRITLSPMVDLKERLTRTPVVDLFEVTSPVASYWRLTSLPTLEKEGWSSYLSYRPANGVMVSDLPDAGRSTRVRQRFEIGPMDRFWLPAAYRPSRIELPGTRVDPETLTLYTRKDSVAGLDYTVESSVPLTSTAELGQVAWVAPGKLGKYRELPADWPHELRTLARDITQGAEGPYLAAQAILEWLQRGFSYDLTVSPGHDGARLAQFLLRDKRGFCEQFAAAFAGMARSSGLPARVAVGWLPGEYDAERRKYVVSTEETHAWAEVYFEGHGWVAFDPTPGRNGRSQDDQGGPISPANSEEAQRRLEGEIDRLDEENEGTGSGIAGAAQYTTGGNRPDPADDASGDGQSIGVARRAIGWFLILLAGLAMAAFLRGVLPPLVKRQRRLARRHRLSPRARVAGAWWEALDRLRETGAFPHQAATPLEFAGGYSQRAPNHRRDVVEALSALAGLFTQATYSAGEPSAEDAEQAWEQVDTLLAALDSSDSRLGRVVRRLDLSTVRRPGGTELAL